MALGTLYLVPTPLGNDATDSIPTEALGLLRRIRRFIVEDERTAQRFLGRIGALPDDAAFGLLTKETPARELPSLLAGLEAGHDAALLSEAGCPAIADPGSEVVRLAHDRGIRVKPLVGPSSIVLALMASGCGGQSFTFHGYLPSERPGRIAAIRALERELYDRRRTQIFIEAPHRNDHLLEDLLSTCREATRLCVAAELTLPGELVVSKRIREWRTAPVRIGKRPAVFLIDR